MPAVQTWSEEVRVEEEKRRAAGELIIEHGPGSDVLRKHKLRKGLLGWSHLRAS